MDCPHCGLEQLQETDLGPRCPECGWYEGFEYDRAEAEAKRRDE